MLRRDADDLGRGGPGAASRPELVLRYSPLDGATGIAVAGEVDLVTRRAWAGFLAFVAGLGEDVHLDLSAVRFIDVAGATLLAQAATRLAPRRLVVHRPPAVLRSMVDLLWGPLSPIVLTAEPYGRDQIGMSVDLSPSQEAPTRCS